MINLIRLEVILKNTRRDDWQQLKPTVYGWGINDVDYKVQIKVEQPRVDGKRKQKHIFHCPYYLDWKGMIERCFSERIHNKQPYYIGTTICAEWQYLSNFIRWVDSQPNKDWQNCEIDKDILAPHRKHYSPETCAYVPSMVNGFVLNCKRSRGDLMLGVSRNRQGSINPYQAYCNNPFTMNKDYLGVFPTELEAHLAWQERKHEYACQLADLQTDERIASRLREMYAPDKDWTKV